MGNKAHKAVALAPGVSGLDAGLDRDASTLSRGVSTASQASLGDADDSVLHFEHTFQARLLVPAHATEAAAAADEGSAEADAETAALLNLPMPRAAGPGAPPTHHAYPPGHPHHMQAHQLGPPLHSSPAPAAAAYKEVPVRITLVREKLTVEEDSGVVLGRAKPPPVLAASFAEVSDICWDHSHSSVKLLLEPAATAEGEAAATNNGEDAGDGKRQFLFALPNSLEMEQEVKLRVTVLRRLRSLKRAVPFQYIGMFAGPTKPKPFQRKRATLSSRLKPGAMPTLDAMKETAMRQYQGAAVPVPTLASRRLAVALQHIHKGFVTFPVLKASHLPNSVVDYDHALLRVDYEGVQFILDRVQGFRGLRDGGTDVNLPFSALASWEAVDGHPLGSSQNGVALRPKDAAAWGGQAQLFFQVRFAADARHVLEFFWNAHRIAQGLDPMPGSTHGRVVETVYTVTGATAKPPLPKGSLRVTDASGRLVCDLGAAAANGSSTNAGADAAPAAESVAVPHRRGPPERPEARAYWGRVVMHQGWLMKKGGFSKKWLRRYFVLYRTCMGHIICYYADHTETALFTEHPLERNVIDCCKVEFIRPVSNTPETPPHAFDIQSVMREWTVCANDQADLQRWLRLLAYAVDADVAVLPDDEMAFMVKPRHDPTMKLYLDEYSTCLRIHAWGVSVDVAEGEARTRVFLWPYTDLYKWTILSQKGKLALQLTVFTSGDYAKRTEFIFRTRNAPRIASVIEYFLEKFMCVMHLKLELDAAEAAADPPTDATTAAATPGSSGSGGGKQQQGQDGHGPASYRRGSSRSLEGEGEGEDGEGEEGNKWASDGEEGDENDERQAEFFGGGGGGRSGSGEDAAGGAFTDPFDAGRHGAGWRADSGDLLLGRGGSSDPIPPSSPPPPEPCASPPPAPSHYVQRGIDGGAKAKMGAWGAALAASGQGVLFESEGVLRVLCRQEFRGHQGHLQLLYTNLGAAPLEGFHATASSNTAGLLIQAHAPAATRLAPQEQTSQTLRVLCMEPFDPICAATGEHAVSVTLEFTTSPAGAGRGASPTAGVAAHYTYPLPLPVSVLHFLSGLEMDRAAFLGQWQAITVPEVRDTFAVQPSTGGAVASAGARYAQAEALTALLTRSFGLKLVRDLCQKNGQMQVLTLAGSLETGTLNPQGKQVRIGVLVRLEQSLAGAKGGKAALPAYRLTVRAVHPGCALAVFRALKHQLLA